jgi:nucleoside-diphosphate-sugar epimerase
MTIKVLITGGNGNIAQIIKRNLSDNFSITNLARNDLNILHLSDIEKYLNENEFDILVHTAILGGRRTKEENGDITHINLVMAENIFHFAHKFKMILNFDSAAIYDRSTNILNRNEEDLFTIPYDYYGFSKYVIYKRSLFYSNIYNFRVFNIYHPNEEKDRFIKACFLAKKNNTVITILQDKYFDFFYEDDFVRIIKYYFDNFLYPDKLQKTINICYSKKYKLSEIATMILDKKENINIIEKECSNNYCGKSDLLDTLGIDFLGLEKSLEVYAEKIKE